MEEQEKRLADFHMEQEAIKRRAADKHAEEKKLREEQVKRLQVSIIRAHSLVVHLKKHFLQPFSMLPFFFVVGRNRTSSRGGGACYKQSLQHAPRLRQCP